MKKFIASLLLLSMCLCIPVFAADNQNSTPMDMDVINGEIVITVDSQEEHDALVAQIEADNMRAQQLWEQAVEESLLPENQVGYTMGISPYATTYVTSVNKSEFFGSLYRTITFEALYTKTTNVAGATVIGSVKSISAYAQSSADAVTVLSKNYTLTDSARTIAANYSLRIRIYNSSSGTSNTYSKQYYVEFYVSGNGRVY